MPPVVNSHVSRLLSYLPFRPGHDQIYEERADPSQLTTIETRASRTLHTLVSDPGTRIAVLTGDAGHGKTHLCRVLVEKVLGLEPVVARDRLLELGDGRESLGRVGDRELYVIRDLSEFPDGDHERLQAALRGEGRVTVVCANEGKLRSVVAAADGELDVLRETIEQGRVRGRTSVADGVHVLDLNNQSVTAPRDWVEKPEERLSFVEGLLKQWAMDSRRWRQCEKCPARASCPILWNREQLAGVGDEGLGQIRRSGLLLLLRVAEQAGAAITIRETLILIAFAITANTDCKEVQGAGGGKATSDSEKRAYFQALFEPPLTEDQRATLSLLEVLDRLDPGRNAIRTVDEVLVSLPRDQAVEAHGVHWMAKPQSKKQMQTEAMRHRGRLAAERRRDFFDLRTESEWRRLLGDDSRSTPRAERLGFRHHDVFEQVLGVGSDKVAPPAIRNIVLKGLEAVQDVRRAVSGGIRFAVVDPAYGNIAGMASILAKEVPAKRIDVLAQSSYWRSLPDAGLPMSSAVDWIDRRVTVRFRPDGQDDVYLNLGLLQFEFVMRSANGLASRKFFQGDIRRIVARLSLLAEQEADSKDEIRVVYEDHNYTIVVEEDGRIVCEAAGQ